MFKVLVGATMATVMGWSGLAYAAEDCKNITDSKARLACYDQASKPGAPTTAIPDPGVVKTPVHFATALRQVGNWAVKIDEDEFTSENKIMVMRLQDGDIFALRCFSGIPTLAFSVSDEKLSAGEPFTFLLRVDKKDIHNTTGEALAESAVESAMDAGLLQEIIDGNILHVRISSSAGTSVDKSFSLTKIGEALKEYRQLCAP